MDAERLGQAAADAVEMGAAFARVLVKLRDAAGRSEGVTLAADELEALLRGLRYAAQRPIGGQP